MESKVNLYGHRPSVIRYIPSVCILQISRIPRVSVCVSMQFDDSTGRDTIQAMLYT